MSGTCAGIIASVTSVPSSREWRLSVPSGRVIVRTKAAPGPKTVKRPPRSSTKMKSARSSIRRILENFARFPALAVGGREKAAGGREQPDLPGARVGDGDGAVGEPGPAR